MSWEQKPGEGYWTTFFWYRFLKLLEILHLIFIFSKNFLLLKIYEKNLSESSFKSKHKYGTTLLRFNTFCRILLWIQGLQSIWSVTYACWFKLTLLILNWLSFEKIEKKESQESIFSRGIFFFTAAIDIIAFNINFDRFICRS